MTLMLAILLVISSAIRKELNNISSIRCPQPVHELRILNLHLIFITNQIVFDSHLKPGLRATITDKQTWLVKHVLIGWKVRENSHSWLRNWLLDHPVNKILYIMISKSCNFTKVKNESQFSRVFNQIEQLIHLKQSFFGLTKSWKFVIWFSWKYGVSSSLFISLLLWIAAEITQILM